MYQNVIIIRIDLLHYNVIISHKALIRNFLKSIFNKFFNIFCRFIYGKLNTQFVYKIRNTNKKHFCVFKINERELHKFFVKLCVQRFRASFQGFTVEVSTYGCRPSISTICQKTGWITTSWNGAIISGTSRQKMNSTPALPTTMTWNCCLKFLLRKKPINFMA